MSKTLFVALGLALASPAWAKGPPSPQQQLMVACNKGWPLYMKANGLKGKDRKSYLSACLSGDITPPVRSRR